MNTKWKLCAATALAVAGCATAHVPLALDHSTTAIRQAQELGASTLPTASVFLQRAMQEQDDARRLDNVGDARAATLLACSDADADLALALAREARARQQEQHVADEVNALRAQRSPQ
jgi:hypothetical protein